MFSFQREESIDRFSACTEFRDALLGLEEGRYFVPH